MNQGFDSPQFVGKGAKTQITGEQTCESLFPVNGGVGQCCWLEHLGKVKHGQFPAPL